MIARSLYLLVIRVLLAALAVLLHLKLLSRVRLPLGRMDEVVETFARSTLQSHVCLSLSCHTIDWLAYIQTGADGGN